MAKILVCFGANLSGQKDFQRLSQKFNEQDFEVHLFDNIQELELMPHSIFNLLEHVWGTDFDQNEYYFLSNIQNYFELCYRVLHNTFKEFIFLNDENSHKFILEFEEVYTSILQNEIDLLEHLEKPVFVNNSSHFEKKFFNDKQKNLDDFFDGDKKDFKVQQNIYCLAGELYLLEPSRGEVVYINLDDSFEKMPQPDSIKLSTAITPFQLDKDLLGKIEEVIELISRDMLTVLKRKEVPHKLFMLIKSILLIKDKKEQIYYISLISVIGKRYGIYSDIYVQTFFLQCYQKSIFYENLLNLALNTEQVNVQGKYYLLTQSRAIEIFDREDFCERLYQLESKLFKQIVDTFNSLIDIKISIADVSEQNDKSVVIFTSQFLGYDHKETAYTLSLAKYLINNNVKCTIINTCEYLSQVGAIPYFDALAPVVISEYTKGNKLHEDGIDIPFIQMISSMPSLGGIEGIIEFIEYEKPDFIINLSELSVIAAMCSDKVSTISIFNNKYIPTPIGNTNILNKYYHCNIHDIIENDKYDLVEVENSLDLNLFETECFQSKLSLNN